MRSRGKISEKIFLLVRHFSDIPLLVRVKTPIFRYISKNAPIKKGMFFKNQGPLFKDKGGFKIWKY
jgi:hypothetical protein